MGPITLIEQTRAIHVAVRLTQKTYFSGLLKLLSKPDVIIKPPSIAQVAPFLDADELIRVNGRLRYSSLPMNAKHPLLLPKSSHLTTLIINYYHSAFLHAGPKFIVSALRQRFWILSARNAIRQCIFKCITCTRYKSSHPKPYMGELPTPRVQFQRVFMQVGMDYGGPYMVKECRRRNARTTKVYIALFVCMAVKAIHIEIVSYLSSEAFLAALDRFVARRGLMNDFYSDCGTNYTGAARQMKSLFDDTAVRQQLTERVPCNWHFNAPAAPHMGGLWEVAIKSIKFHLKRVIGMQILTVEEFNTLTVRIEGILVVYRKRELAHKGAAVIDLLC
ncbi:uncharacterized protein LOC126896059 [Daktulosphaira vitifoliae]|uniref:uncharacterized protein LOC126896059 n=1 Tax=Daktulosphaira vitifoliae TaxID=58002 RepID=UPI0021A9C86B|nr:uncharacterized protein LOC126896059 [Daktulosphaira vitifoliae]